jgi:hypothetical protein
MQYVQTDPQAAQLQSEVLDAVAEAVTSYLNRAREYVNAHNVVSRANLYARDNRITPAGWQGAQTRMRLAGIQHDAALATLIGTLTTAHDLLLVAPPDDSFVADLLFVVPDDIASALTTGLDLAKKYQNAISDKSLSRLIWEDVRGALDLQLQALLMALRGRSLSAIGATSR